LQDGAGWRPAAALDLQLPTVSARIQADPGVQAGEVRWMPGAVTLAAGTARTGGGGGVAGGASPPAPGALWLAWGDAGLALGRLRTGGGVAWDLGAAAFSGADARLGYDDGCVAATVSARFSPDRAVPDVGFAATFRR
ncbi:MAG: hypothetical protein ACK4YP_15990, partial [Myxococcota bacterium]